MNYNAEEQVLGSLMLDNNSIHHLNALESICFNSPIHRHIFDAIRSLERQNRPFDFSIVSEELKRERKLTKCGGSSYLIELINSVPTTANIEHYVKIVQNDYLHRELRRICDEAKKSSINKEADPVDIINDLQTKAMKLYSKNGSNDCVMVKDIISDVVDDIENAFDKDGITGITTGFKSLDNTLGGMEEGQLIIIAARPAMGKSALATCIQYYAAQQGIASACFTMEMTKKEMTRRLYSIDSQIEASRLKKGNLHDQEMRKIGSAMASISALPISINDQTRLTPSILRQKLIKLKKEQDIKFCVVDHLGLMKADKGFYGKRLEEVSEIARELKAIANDVGITMIALSQLNRAVEGRPDKRPVLSDLRESGEIEQSANVVMMLYRESYYNDQADNSAEIFIRKNRDGQCGVVRMTFRNEITKFIEI